MGWQDGTPVAPSAPAAPAWSQGTPVDPQQAYNELSWPAKILQAADDTVRLVTNGATLGYGDKIAARASALIGDGDYSANLAAEQAHSNDAAARAGVAGLADSVLGMAGPAGLIGRGMEGVSAAASAIPGVVGRVAAIPGVAQIGTGAIVGGVDAAGHDQDPALGAVLGAGSGLAGHVIGGRLTAFAPPTPAAPTAQALYDAANTGYSGLRALGVEYAPPSVAAMAAGAKAALESRGIYANLADKTHAVLDQLVNVPPGATSVPLTALEAARQGFGHIGRNFNNPTDQLAASEAQRAIDSFVANPPPSAVLAGPAGQAAQLAADARGNYAAGARSDDLNGVGQAAALRAAAANSGANVGNTIRQRVASLLLDPRAVAGFTPDEKAALEEVVKGTPTRNAARIVGNLLGGGGGLGSAVSGAVGATAGAVAGGTPGAIIGAAAPIAGFAAKSLDNAMGARALQAVDEATRQRSPLYAAMLASAPAQHSTQTAAAALLRAANAPVSNAIMNAGINSSLAEAEPDSRAATLSKILTKTRPAPDVPTLGDLFSQ